MSENPDWNKITLTKVVESTVVSDEVITDDRRQTIIALRQERLSCKAIGKIVGLSGERVRQILRGTEAAATRKTADDRRRDALQAIQVMAGRFGRPPTFLEYRKSGPGDPQYLFGSWNGALQAAGFPPRPTGHRVTRRT